MTGVTAAVLALAGAGTTAGCGRSGDEGASGRTPHTDTRWAGGITPEWMSEHMGLGLPATARAPRAAYKVTSRFDTGLLTFTLTRSEAETYLEKHPPSGKWLTPTSAQDVPPYDFAHLGVPEPEKFKDGMRYGDVCPGAGRPGGTPDAAPTDPYDTSDENCVSLYAHAYAPGRTRIYLRAHFEPGISPLPSPT